MSFHNVTMTAVAELPGASKMPEIIQDLRDLLECGVATFIWGAPGIGKSEIVFQVAADIRRAEIAALGPLSNEVLAEIAQIPTVIDIRLSTFDPVDLRGLPALVDGLTKWMRPAIWPVENRWNLTVILFFDEMDRAAPAVANAALQIVLDKKIGEHVLPDTVRIVAAGNGATDRGTTNKIGQAQANRFTHLYAVADAESAAAHWASIGLDPALPAFIRFRDTLIQTAPTQGEHAFGSPRAWAKMDKFMHLPDARRHRKAIGTVGRANAGEFESFVRMFRSLPSIDAIIRDPAGAPLPTELSVSWAVMGALSRKANHGNFAQIAAYVARMSREFEIACITDAVRRDAGLKASATYVNWAIANQDAAI